MNAAIESRIRAVLTELEAIDAEVARVAAAGEMEGFEYTKTTERITAGRVNLAYAISTLRQRTVAAMEHPENDHARGWAVLGYVTNGVEP